jgi:hypothetical protein
VLFAARASCLAGAVHNPNALPTSAGPESPRETAAPSDGDLDSEVLSSACAIDSTCSVGLRRANWEAGRQSLLGRAHVRVPCGKPRQTVDPVSDRSKAGRSCRIGSEMGAAVSR